MTLKEITALRKSGKVDEALAAAETEYANTKNRYTAGALFWCLNEKCKSVWGDEGYQIYNRMRELCDLYGKDEYMAKSLNHTERHLIPHASSLRNAVEAAKDGADALTSYAVFAELYDRDEIDPRIHDDLGWLTLYALRQSDGSDLSIIKRMLLRYLKLSTRQPSVLHSKIMGEAVKAAKDNVEAFAFNNFADIWGLDNLTKDDWRQPHTNDGRVIHSLVEKVISAYMKCIKDQHKQPSEAFVSLLDKAIDTYPSNQNLAYHKALILIGQGKRDDALSYYRRLILANRNKSYLWINMADLIDDNNVKIGLLCRGLTCGDRPEYLGKCHIRLAELLYADGKPDRAKYELERYRETYERFGWHLNDRYMSLAAKVANEGAPADNRDLYNTYSQYADAFVYSDIPSVYAVKVNSRLLDDRFNPAQKVETWTLRTPDGILYLRNPRRHKLDYNMPNGTVFTVQLSKDKIINITPANDWQDIDWIKRAEGSAHMRTDRNGNRYTIIDNVYVPDRLLDGIADGEQVGITALTNNDGKWVAVNLTKKQ